MTTRTFPPVHHTMGERRADVVQIVGIVLRPSRRAISTAAACNSRGAAWDSDVNWRLKRHTRTSDQTRTTTLPSNQIGGNHPLPYLNKAVAILDVRGVSGCFSIPMGGDCEMLNSRRSTGRGGGCEWFSTATAVVSLCPEIGITGIVTSGGVTSLTRTSNHSRFAR